MAAHKGSGQAQESNVTVVNVHTWPRLVNKWSLTVLIILVVLGGGAVLWAARGTNGNQEAASKAQLQTLQVSLAGALEQGDNGEIINIASQLISGVNDHSFTIGNSDLARIYMQRAAAEGDLREYPQGLHDYEAATKLDGSVRLSALQGEATLQNAAGNKQALIPLLQQLVTLEQHSTQPFAASDAAHYQAVIQAIQQHQEYDL